MYHSADRFKYSYLISNRRCSCRGNGWVGLAQLTCRSKKLSVGKISGLKTMWYGPEDAETHPKKCRVKSSEKTKPALLSTCCANSFNGCELIHEPMHDCLRNNIYYGGLSIYTSWTLYMWVVEVKFKLYVPWLKFYLQWWKDCFFSSSTNINIYNQVVVSHTHFNWHVMLRISLMFEFDLNQSHIQNSAYKCYW